MMEIPPNGPGASHVQAKSTLRAEVVVKIITSVERPGSRDDFQAEKGKASLLPSADQASGVSARSLGLPAFSSGLMKMNHQDDRVQAFQGLRAKRA